MRFFVLPGLLLSTVSMLTSCSSVSDLADFKPVTPKVFQYAYQEPARTLSDTDFARQLSLAKEGTRVKIKLKNKRVSNARLGRRYFSASGYQCRKYFISSQKALVSCLIGGHWQEASPVVVDSIQYR